MSGPRAGAPGTAGAGYRRTLGPLLIVAGNLRLAHSAAMDLGLPPRPGRLWQYVSDEHALRGRDRVRVHEGPRFWDHPRADRIDEYLRIIAYRGDDRVQWIRTQSDLLVSTATAEAMLEGSCRSFVNAYDPPVVTTGSDILRNLREAMQRITTQVVVHPDVVDRVKTAAEGRPGLPVEVTSSSLVPAGRAFVFPPTDEPAGDFSLWRIPKLADEEVAR